MEVTITKRTLCKHLRISQRSLDYYIRTENNILKYNEIMNLYNILIDKETNVSLRKANAIAKLLSAKEMRIM